MSKDGEVAVIGVGMYPYGKYPDKAPQELGVHTIREALKDAGIEWKDIQAMAASCSANTGGVGWLPGHCIAQAIGETGIRVNWLLQLDGCASLFEFGLDAFSLFLGSPLFDGIRRVVH